MIYVVLLSPKSSGDQTKKKGLHSNWAPYSAGIDGDLFMVTGNFSSDQPALQSWWGDAISQWGNADS